MNAIPPVNGILETALYVDDVDRSARFYQDLFGFEVVSSGARLTAMAVPGRQVLLLFKKGASVNLPTIPHDGMGQLHMAFAIDRSELEPWAGRLKEKGIEIVDRIEWERGGVSLYFRDPDKHLIELATPGLWSNY